MSEVNRFINDIVRTERDYATLGAPNACKANPVTKIRSVPSSEGVYCEGGFANSELLLAANKVLGEANLVTTTRINIRRVYDSRRTYDVKEKAVR